MGSVFHSKLLSVLQHRAFLLDVVVRQCHPVFGLLSFEDRSLLVGMNAFLVLDLAFTLSMVSLAFVIERSCLARQRLDEDLHATMQCVLLGFGGDGLRRFHAFGFLRLPRLPAFGPSVF